MEALVGVPTHNLPYVDTGKCVYTCFTRSYPKGTVPKKVPGLALRPGAVLTGLLWDFSLIPLTSLFPPHSLSCPCALLSMCIAGSSELALRQHLARWTLSSAGASWQDCNPNSNREWLFIVFAPPFHLSRAPAGRTICSQAQARVSFHCSFSLPHPSDAFHPLFEKLQITGFRFSTKGTPPNPPPHRENHRFCQKAIFALAELWTNRFLFDQLCFWTFLDTRGERSGRHLRCRRLCMFWVWQHSCSLGHLLFLPGYTTGPVHLSPL